MNHNTSLEFLKAIVDTYSWVCDIRLEQPDRLVLADGQYGLGDIPLVELKVLDPDITQFRILEIHAAARRRFDFSHVYPKLDGVDLDLPQLAEILRRRTDSG